ncbi:MAG: TetR family transcriptional regulator [Deltaproteobacteria bacterium]|nr:TetR family transcriptional regulator [Deltaproteobacteria bacterium]
MARPSNTDARRGEIVEALRRVMAEHGYEKATVSRIAEAAGLAPGLVHYHFGSKEEVLLALVDDLTGRAEARMDERLAAAGPDPRERLGAVLEALLATGSGSDPDAVACWTLIGAEAIRHPAVRAAYQTFVSQTVARLRRESLAACRAEGRAGGGVGAIAAGLMATVEGYFGLAAAVPGLVPEGTAAATARRIAFGLLDAQPPVAE